MVWAGWEKFTPNAQPVAKRQKYGNQKTDYNGVTFDSKKELKKWQELQLLEKSGLISDLQRQVAFPLIVNGRHVGRFTADYTWIEDGQKVVADAKSAPTRKETAYRLRKRVFEAQYAPLTIREV